MHCQELKDKREILGFQELQENLGHQDSMVVKVLKEKMVSLSFVWLLFLLLMELP